MTRRRRLLLGLLAAGLGLVLALGLGEVVVRLLALQSDNFYRPDPWVGWVHIPGKRGLYVSDQARAQVRINDRGLVGPEFSLPKPPGRRHLLLLGDSFTQSLQVPYEQSWASHLKERLAGGWEVLNAGVAGYGTDNALLYLQKYGWDLDPDAVFLMFFTGNDVSDNDPALRARIGGAQAQPTFTLVDGQLQLRDHPLPESAMARRGGPRVWMRERSRLYRFVRDRLYRLRNLQQQTEEEAGGIPLTWHVYRKDPGPEWEGAWELTEALLRQLQEETRARGVPLAVGIVPTGWRIEPDQWDAMLQQHPQLADTLQWDLAGPDRRLKALLQKLDVPCLDLRTVLERSIRSGEPLYGDHFTPRGHVVVADAVAAFLQNTVLGPP